MGLSDWFTIFGLFLAVYALFSAEERKIITLKLGRFDPYILILTLFGTLYLIKYDEIRNKLTFLDNFNVTWGLNPSNLALILFLSTTVFYAIKLIKLPNRFPNHLLIGYYQEMMKQDFKSFFRLFNKYEKNATNKKHFNIYQQIIFDPIFLDGVSDQPYYYTDILDQIDEETFNRYFRNLLNNHDSIYYKELKLNDDYYFVEEGNYFLYTLLHEKPALFFRIGGMGILKEWYLKYLENERLKRGQSIYNQPTDVSLDGFELSLPLYLHILFVKLLYQEAIVQKIDTSTLSDRFINMQSIFSHLMEKAIENIDKATYKECETQEYPLKYHYLFAEIFRIIEQWIEEFNKPKYFIKESSLFEFFPFCMHLCIQELIKGLEKEVISEGFLVSRIHYNLLSTYYKHDLNDDLLLQLEKICILEIPQYILQPAIEYSLDEAFALDYEDFKDGNFFHPGSSPHEMVIIKRLHTLLSTHDKL